MESCTSTVSSNGADTRPLVTRKYHRNWSWPPSLYITSFTSYLQTFELGTVARKNFSDSRVEKIKTKAREIAERELIRHGFNPFPVKPGPSYSIFLYLLKTLVIVLLSIPNFPQLHKMILQVLVNFVNFPFKLLF